MVPVVSVMPVRLGVVAPSFSTSSKRERVVVPDRSEPAAQTSTKRLDLYAPKLVPKLAFGRQISLQKPESILPAG